MARIDSILRIVVQQGAAELRIGTDRPPRMLAGGAPRRLALGETSDEMLRTLLGPLLSDREAALEAKGRLDFTYAPDDLGTFMVTLVRRAAAPELGAGIDAVFKRGGTARVEALRREPSLVDAARPGATPLASTGADPTKVGPPRAAAPAEVPHPTAPESATVREPLVPSGLVASGLVTSGLVASAEGPYRGGMSTSLRELLEEAVALRASDVHLRDGEPAYVRVDGRLRPLGGATISATSMLGPVLDETATTRLATRESADFVLDLTPLGRFRVNVYRVGPSLAAAIRLLPARAPRLSELRLPMPLGDLVELPHGLVLVCGATGSGKSTTLAALAQEALTRRSVLLVSLEDPVEYPLDATGTTSLVRQRQVGRDVRDVTTGLRDALREDPDIILVGEMRDAETIGLALTAAETGHLVLATLHSRSAPSAIERIVDAYAPERHGQIRVQLADALRAVVCQRLVPRARGSGRVVATEVLRATHGVSALIREGRTQQLVSAMQSARKEGMLVLERSLADWVRSGDVTLESARAVANDATLLDHYLRAAPPG